MLYSIKTGRMTTNLLNSENGRLSNTESQSLKAYEFWKSESFEPELASMHEIFRRGYLPHFSLN